VKTHLFQSAVILVLLASVTLAWTSAATAFARRIEHGLAALANRKTLCWCGLGALVLILRASLLPVWPAPKPVVYDEFSYLLQADTFAHGRLSTPTHALWPFFESIFILQKPTYASRYPPGQGLVMAAGQRLFGHPWFGVWLSAGLLAAALCWALQGWLPPPWALFGGALGAQLCFFSYWMNSYWGGAVAAIGGALMIGAYPRIVAGRGREYAWVLGLGAVVLIATRPYEGLLLIVPVLIALVRRDRSAACWGPIALVGILGAAWLGYYNFRVTGNAFRLPYQEYFAQYESVPPFNVLPLASGRSFRHFDLEWLDRGYALDLYHKSRSFALLVSRPSDWFAALKDMLGETLLVGPLIALAPLLWRQRRTRYAAALAGIMLAGSLIEVAWFPHYGAPFTAVVLLLGVEAFRALQMWRARGRRLGRFLVRALPFAAWTIMIGNDAVLITQHQTPDQVLPINSHRDDLARILLQQHPGKHVILVHYTGVQSPHEEWIYNPAGIDDSPVIWAQDMGDTENERLAASYRGRSFWLLLPDRQPLELNPYSDDMR